MDKKEVKLLLGRPTVNLRIWWLRVRPAPGTLFFMDEEAVRLIQLLLVRLEHISADSVWAHRASGIRGSLLRALERNAYGETVPGANLEPLIAAGFHILENVVRENFKRNSVV